MNIDVTERWALPYGAVPRFLESLRGRKDWRRRYLRKAIRYSLLSLVAPRKQAQWLALIASQPAYQLAIQRDPRLLERWQHRSINLRFWVYRRLDVLLGHHQHLLRLLPPTSLERLYREGQCLLASAAMKNSGPIDLFLALPVCQGHEGELNLCVRSHDDPRVLFTMTLSFDPGHNSVLIGCLQGPAGTDGLERVKEVTKQCFGLRPKNLLLSVAYALTQVSRFERVLGISNRAHAWSRQSQVAACYDSFWQESGGVLRKDGFYDLGKAEPERDEREIPSKRRAAFRQREALRADLVRQVVASCRH